MRQDSSCLRLQLQSEGADTLETVVPKSTRWARENPEKVREAGRAYYHQNKEKRKQKAAEWRKANPEKVRAWYEKKRIEKYGITVEQYQDLLDSQDGKCAVCKSEFTHTPHIDHCHSTGVVRGLLCPTCNTGLGKFRDNVDVLLSAISYLKRNQSYGCR